MDSEKHWFLARLIAMPNAANDPIHDSAARKAHEEWFRDIASSGLASDSVIGSLSRLFEQGPRRNELPRAG